MPSTCEFYLSNHDGIYHSGDTVSCTIVLNTTKPKDVKEITITLLGQAYVKWTERERHGQTQTCVDYTAKEPYLDNTVTVSREGTLPAGFHTYKYDIVIPPESRASYEGPDGHIRYELTLKLTRPYRSNNEFTKVLTVISKRDLNLNPVLRLPIENEEILTSFWCCGTGIINTKLKIPFGGYAIDQFVDYSVHVQNESKADINSYTIQFIRKITFTSHKPKLKTRDEETTLFKKQHGVKCLRYTNRIFDGSFPIYDTPASTVGETIISVQYLLKVTLNMTCSNADTISIPIFVADIPFKERLVAAEPLETDPLTVPTVEEQLSWISSAR
ncbi:arrestin domain-containing protein 17-like [Calliphora vicina]|uniref:arrestin domain-containing protein 17-like n=1 Tax=Calliphora vicina TaxID=7373 RepID=UPI00325B085A